MLSAIRRELRRFARAEDAAILRRFFKTAPGEYGEGDRFLGIRVPAIRRCVGQTDGLGFRDIRGLLHSPYHEERLLALLILVRRFRRGAPSERERIFRFYLVETRFINNWDLVDLSAPHIVGSWLLDHPEGCLDMLAGSDVLWERRIAVLATFAFIRNGRFNETLRLCEMLLDDRHDLIHKACGWMLRETGKRDEHVLERFLEDHTARMPRTMLRYAIERLPETRRQAWMKAKSGS